MRTLYLLRHAKSSWADPSLNDHERPLNARGLEACERLARYFRREGVAPDLVLCSTAERTRATLHGVMPGLPAPLDVRFDPRLYLAEPEQIMALLRLVPAAVQRLMVIGHNPGLEELLTLLPGEDISAQTGHGLALQFEEKFPTGGFAAFTADIDDWAGFAPGCARMLLLTAPKEIGS